jgi:hypothetical protein
MTAILQLKLPIEIQGLIREFVHYSKVEHLQRKQHKKLMKQFTYCERLQWSHSPHYDYFYYKIENWDIRIFEKDLLYITQDIQLMSCIFCKECNNYLYTNTEAPECILCGCLPILLTVD